MPDLLRRLAAVIAGADRLTNARDLSLRRNRFMRFLVAGGVNTLFGFAVYSIAILMGAAVWLALLAGMLFGTGFNFVTTGGYVFRELLLARFPRFLVCYLFVYAVNLSLIELLSIWLSDKILSQAVITIPMALLAYFAMMKFVFPPRPDREVNPAQSG